MKTLHFLSYPITNPQHGGQLRCAALQAALRRAGFETASISVFDIAHYQDFSASDMPLASGLFNYYIMDHPWDLKLSDVVANNDELYPEFVRKVTEINADCYIFEQPWLWPLMRKVMADFPNLVRPVVYSSQNIEFDLIRAIMKKNTPELNAHDQWLVDYTYAIEKELCEYAELVVCCTARDMEFFNSVYAIKHICYFANGINPPGVVSADVERKYAERYRGLRIASFVGSAHPPNADGWEEMLGENMGFIPPDCRVAIIGGVADLLRQRKGWTGVFRGLNASRIDMLGRLPQEELDAVLARADLMILPITTGGGSNLKTAEALISGKPILATRLSFRGYDEFSSFPGIYLTDDPGEFRRQCCDLLRNPHPVERTPEQVKQTEKVLWQNILADYPEQILQLMKK